MWVKPKEHNNWGHISTYYGNVRREGDGSYAEVIAGAHRVRWPDGTEEMLDVHMGRVTETTYDHGRATSRETTTLSLQRDDNGTIFFSFDLTPRHELEIASDPCTPVDLVRARLFQARDEDVPALFDRLLAEGPGHAASVFLDGVRAGWVGYDDANEEPLLEPRHVAHLIDARTLLPLLESNCLDVALRQGLIAALGTVRPRQGRGR